MSGNPDAVGRYRVVMGPVGKALSSNNKIGEGTRAHYKRRFQRRQGSAQRVAWARAFVHRAQPGITCIILVLRCAEDSGWQRFSGAW